MGNTGKLTCGAVRRAFLIGVFDEWASHDVGRIEVQNIEEALMNWRGIGAVVCVYKDICGRALALEDNGDLYACDHFVEPRHRLGNIHHSTISEMANSSGQEEFGHAKMASQPSSRRNCGVRFLCNCGCPKDRFYPGPSGAPGQNYPCEGYRMFHTHMALSCARWPTRSAPGVVRQKSCGNCRHYRSHG